VKVPPFELPLEEIRRSLQPLRRPLRVAVLRARNAFNIGAIIRVAHSFLVSEIVLVGEEPFYERAAMGMHRYETIVSLPSDEALLAWARERHLPVVVFEREQARTDLWRADLPAACLMVFGNEAEGVTPAILAAADEVVGIPMYGINNSYPVSVAAGIAMAEWTRRHYGPPPP
jgi:tRNA G18 (ribose-2'-O)-methylase SpoU